MHSEWYTWIKVFWILPFHGSRWELAFSVLSTLWKCFTHDNSIGTRNGSSSSTDGSSFICCSVCLRRRTPLLWKDQSFTALSSIFITHIFFQMWVSREYQWGVRMILCATECMSPIVIVLVVFHPWSTVWVWWSHSSSSMVSTEFHGFKISRVPVVSIW